MVSKFYKLNKIDRKIRLEKETIPTLISIPNNSDDNLNKPSKTLQEKEVDNFTAEFITVQSILAPVTRLHDGASVDGDS